MEQEKMAMELAEVGAIERLQSLYSLHIMPRWSIVAMMRGQSVAEHTFGVMVIAEALNSLLGTPVPVGDLLQAAMQHDMGECATADIPHPVKEDRVAGGYMRGMKARVDEIMEDLGSMQYPLVPNALVDCIVHIADNLEAYTFCQRYCISGSVEARVLNRIAEATRTHKQALVSAFKLDERRVEMAMMGVAKALADDSTFWQRLRAHKETLPQFQAPLASSSSQGA